MTAAAFALFYTFREHKIGCSTCNLKCSWGQCSLACESVQQMGLFREKNSDRHFRTMSISFWSELFKTYIHPLRWTFRNLARLKECYKNGSLPVNAIIELVEGTNGAFRGNLSLSFLFKWFFSFATSLQFVTSLWMFPFSIFYAHH